MPPPVQANPSQNSHQPLPYGDQPVQADTVQAPAEEVPVEEGTGNEVPEDVRPTQAGSKRTMQDRRNDEGHDAESQQGNQKKEPFESTKNSVILCVTRTRPRNKTSTLLFL